MKTKLIAALKPLYAAPLLLAAPAIAQSLAGLPDAAVLEAIETHPRTRAADARVEAARQHAGALRAGPHEFSLSGDYGRRSVQGEGDFNEYSVMVERPVRLPGKGALDRKSGELGIAAAQLRAEDARHQLALLLAELWWDWLIAEDEVRIAATTQTALERAEAAVERQVALQDAALVDLDRARAEVHANSVELKAAQARAEVARGRLQAQFPNLPLPAIAPALGRLEIEPGERDALRDHVTRCDHELPAARLEAEQKSVAAERLSRDRLADPTVGVRVFSERDGLERGASVVFSIPLGGGRRSALADQAHAEALSAAAEAEAIRYEVYETSQTDHTEARLSVEAWQASLRALESSTSALDRLRQGYRLGHVDLAELLFAERQAKAAALAESRARGAALRAETRLRVDAHALWLDCGHVEAGAP